MARKPNEMLHDALVWKGRRITLTQPCLIGRGSDNDIVLDDKEVSRRYAMIYSQGNDWWLSDLGSRNGLRVNGIRLLHARRLREGDELDIGTQSLRFLSAEVESQRTAVTLGETTHIASAERHASLNGPLICELIVTASNGEILEGEKAARWFFGSTLERPPGNAHSFLPGEVCAWLGRQNLGDSVTGGVELELMDRDRRVVINLCRRKPGRYFLLVREESVHAPPPRTSSGFGT